MVGLLLVIGAIVAAQANPMETLQNFLQGSLGSPRGIAATLKETMPLLVAGLGVFLALRAGLFNIGIEGQLMVGGLCCASIALAVPGWLGAMLGILAAMAGGMIWALPAGLIKAYRGGHEVITTIMLNNIALLLTGAVVSGPLKASGQQSSTTAMLETTVPLVSVGPMWQFSPFLFVGIALTLAIGWWLRRTVAGYELQAAGENPTAAQVAGISASAVTVRAMVSSGALGGLTGAMMVLGYEGRFYDDFSPGYGFTALGVALLAGSQAWLVIPGALLFGILERGGTYINAMGIPKGITLVVLGFLILIAGALRFADRSHRMEGSR